MDNKTVLSDNELIAEFMGIDFTSKEAYERWAPPICKKYGRYDTSWDWLMPCFKRANELILKSGWGTPTEKEAFKRLRTGLNEVYNINIENAHYCLVQFIKWYNSTKTL